MAKGTERKEMCRKMREWKERAFENLSILHKMNTRGKTETRQAKIKIKSVSPPKSESLPNETSVQINRRIYRLNIAFFRRCRWHHRHHRCYGRTFLWLCLQLVRDGFIFTSILQIDAMRKH